MQVGHGLLGLPEFVAVAHGATIMDPLPELCAAEAEYVHERAIAARRRSFTVGRYAAHCALGLLQADRGPILRGDHGQPIWPSGVVGSITHAGDRVAVAVARNANSGGIGLDIEHVGRYFPELIAHIAFGDERSRLEAIDEQTTRVTESFEWGTARFPPMYEWAGYPKKHVGNIAATLERLEQVVTS